MNQLVKLAVGSALALAASSAFASVSLPSAATGGSLTLTLFSTDDSTPFSYAFDTGLTVSTLGTLPTSGSESWTLTGLGTDLSGFGGTSSLVFDVTAGAQAAGNPAKTAGLYNFATTFDPTVTLATIQSIQNGAIETAVANNNTWLGNYGAGQTSFTTSTTAANYANANYNSNLNDFAVNAATSVSNSLPFYELTQAKGGASTVGSAPSTFAGTWSVNLSTDMLTYTVAPVPLPAGVWLLLSGLTGMGLLGRRRRDAAV